MRITFTPMEGALERGLEGSRAGSTTSWVSSGQLSQLLPSEKASKLGLYLYSGRQAYLGSALTKFLPLPSLGCSRSSKVSSFTL